MHCIDATKLKIDISKIMMLEAYSYRLVYSSVSQMDINEHTCVDVVYRHITLKIHIDSNSMSIMW
jgi:hypothetical protein